MKAYLAGMWRCRYFWLSLVKMDLRARYRGSVLGLGWSMLHPIAMTVILCLVFRNLFDIDLHRFAPMVMAGLTYWAYLMSVTTVGCLCFFQGESYIRQHPAPMAIYPLRTMLGGGFHFLLALGLVVLLAVWCQGAPPSPVGMLSLLPTLALLAVFGWSLATLFGLATVLFRDSRHISEIIFQALFYLTPVMYPEEQMQKRHIGLLLKVNPFAYFLKLVRDPILDGQPASLKLYLAATTITLITFALAAAALRSQERRLIFHL
jgi:ABC-type polysaccharide/polyol phosphate export permease